MKKTLFFILSITLSSTSVTAADLFIECQGRSFLHRVLLDDFQSGAFRYQIKNFWGDANLAEFSVDLVQMNHSEQIFRLANRERQVAIGVDGDGVAKKLRGIDGVQATGFAFAKEVTRDQIRNCWINPKLIPE